MPEEPGKLVPQEEATYAEPILVPTVNKSMALTGGGVAGDVGLGAYMSTSPKATLRKVANHNAANVALFETNANAGTSIHPSIAQHPSADLFDGCHHLGPPCPPPNNIGTGGMYAYGVSGVGVGGGGGGAASDNYTAAGAPPRDPYSSFRHRDAYGGSMRSHASFAHGPAPLADNFGTLRSNKTANVADNYGTTRSVKKVYL